MAIKPARVHCAQIALQKEMPELSPAAKYLFVRAMFLFGKQNHDGTRNQLAVQVGMPLNALIPAHEELIEAGWAHAVRAPSYSRKGPTMTTQGSFRRGFALAPDVVDEIEVRASGMGMARQCRMREMLEALLLWPESGSQPEVRLPKGVRLRYANRLLMGVLLALADGFGVVRDSSFGRLAELTGMTTSQVGTQLRKLSRVGFIRYRVPGVNGRALFPKAPGALVLNFGDKLVSRPRTGPPIPEHVFTEKSREIEPIMRFLGGHRSRARPARDLFSFDCNRFVDEVVRYRQGWTANTWLEEHERAVEGALIKAADALSADPREGVVMYAQHKLCNCASDIFNSPGFAAKPGLDPRDAMVAHLHSSLLKPGLAGEPAPSVLAAIFYFFAANLASEVLEWIQGHQGALPTGGRWAVLPSRDTSTRVTVLFLPPDPPVMNPGGKPGT